MDIKISGSGIISAGEYDSVLISGSAKVDGNVKCQKITCSGSIKAEADIVCENTIKISGGAKFSKSISAGGVYVSGSLKCGSLTAKNEIEISGSAKVESKIKCTDLVLSGSTSVKDGIEAEDVKIYGGIKCDGLLNAEKIEMDANGGINVDSIGGGEIRIYPRRNRNRSILRLPLLSSLVSGDKANVGTIEGDVIALENVMCKSVKGRIIAIGEGCKVDFVQYSEEIEINPKAEVVRYEKV